MSKAIENEMLLKSKETLSNDRKKAIGRFSR